jgi:hypothetical protein
LIFSVPILLAFKIYFVFEFEVNLATRAVSIKKSELVFSKGAAETMEKKPATMSSKKPFASKIAENKNDLLIAELKEALLKRNRTKINENE